jgi:hypothetical protein
LPAWPLCVAEMVKFPNVTPDAPDDGAVGELWFETVTDADCAAAMPTAAKSANPVALAKYRAFIVLCVMNDRLMGTCHGCAWYSRV